jgi:hypothetical protein
MAFTVTGVDPTSGPIGTDLTIDFNGAPAWLSTEITFVWIGPGQAQVGSLTKDENGDGTIDATVLDGCQTSTVLVRAISSNGSVAARPLSRGPAKR